MKKVESFVHVLVPLFFLHLIEELFTKFDQMDSSVNYLNEYLNLTPQITFLLIQLLLFIFLAILLVFILYRKKIPLVATLLLVVVSLYEFSHLIETFKTQSYYPGLVTGLLIGIIGVVLWYKILARKLNQILATWLGV